MKVLYLIRHGKSSWTDDSLADKERPLKKRGEKDAIMMAKFIRKSGITPKYIVSSPANRALSTAGIFAKCLGYDEKKIAVDELLYFGGINNILNVIHQLDNKHEVAFIFGHNPDLTEIANRFSEQSIDNVPTSGVVGVEFKVDAWKDASFSNGKMVFFDYPSNHK